MLAARQPLIVYDREHGLCVGICECFGCPHCSAGADKMGEERLQDGGKTLENASPEGSTRAELQEGEKKWVLSSLEMGRLGVPTSIINARDREMKKMGSKTIWK